MDICSKFYPFYWLCNSAPLLRIQIPLVSSHVLIYSSFPVSLRGTMGPLLRTFSFLKQTFKAVNTPMKTAYISKISVQFSSVQSLSHVRLFVTPWLQHTRLPCLYPTPGVYSNSCPLSRWCHPTISSSVVVFSSCLQSFPASESFQMSQLFTSGGQSTRVSPSASVLPMNIQDWFPLGWTGWIALQFKGLSRVFSNTTVQNHEFFSAQLSL